MQANPSNNLSFGINMHITRVEKGKNRLEKTFPIPSEKNGEVLETLTHAITKNRFVSSDNVAKLNNIISSISGKKIRLKNKPFKPVLLIPVDNNSRFLYSNITWNNPNGILVAFNNR